MISVRGVTASAGAFALRDISFDIPSNAFGVVVGPAGAGKTTLLESIAGVRTMDGGTVMLASRDATHWPPEQRGIGFVYQRGALFPHRSVRDNIGWAGGLPETVVAIVERFGIAALLATPVASLSGGERQLVALARALVRVRQCLDRGQPGLLLLDEPLSALDPRRRLATRDLVRAYHREWSLTTLLVTHDGTDAARADVAVLLEAGRVVQSGAPAALLAHPAREDVALFLSGAI